jgi:hypothetical protein
LVKKNDVVTLEVFIYQIKRGKMTKQNVATLIVSNVISYQIASDEKQQ